MPPNLTIDDKPELIEKFAIPDMSLSSGRSGMRQHSFSIVISENELIDCLNSDYQEMVLELKKDDEQVGSPQDDLAIAGYPELIDVIKEVSLLELAVGYYLLRDLLAKFSVPSGLTNYWLDEVSNCRYDSGLVHINGICYSVQ